jgi:uncharacterized protein (DUF697 family)
VTTTTLKTEESNVLSFIKSISNQAIDGVSTFSGANELAQTYLRDKSYEDNDARVNALINWESSKNFTTGFITGLGGLITLPVTIPVSLGSSLIIQTRMIAAIAYIYGYDIDDDRVRTLIVLSLLGDGVKEVLKDVGIKIGKELTYQAIQKIPEKLLIEINKQVGFKLLSKAGESAIINFTKFIPFVGGVIGGAVDLAYCQFIGEVSKSIFKK